MSDAPSAAAAPRASVAAASGVLPAQEIRRLIAEGRIAAASPTSLSGARTDVTDAPVRDDQVQPASLDLRLGSVAYRVRASFLAGHSATVAQRLDDFAMHEIDLRGGAALETGCVYVAPLQERVRLPKDVSGVANAKSSTGRLDLFTRLITDHGAEFDRVAPGYEGPLYAEISPRTFSVLARAGDRLNQIRLRRGSPAFAADQIEALQSEHQLISGAQPASGGGLRFSVDLEPGDGRPVGYRARRNSALIDLAKLDHYDPSDFWDPLTPRRFGAGGALGVILYPGAFYILVSRERVRVPPDLAAEMTPYLAVVGEFRVHYAGFFDPGFGCEETGGAGARGVLEVRCHEAPFALEHGQTVGRLVYEPMLARPDILYGEGIGSNYQAQGLRLSKHFKQG
ncbi:MAG: 2'-deoxycytidine 5'-triphosphate deaminase [Pseudomonadota bacterium]